MMCLDTESQQSMRVLAEGVINGHEARGAVRVVESEDGSRSVELSDLWVAPGAPDVRLYTSPYPDGRIDDSATDLGKVPDAARELHRPLPPNATPPGTQSVVIYCKVYSVEFGHATLEWNDP